jgi:hypothetical protein
LAKSDAANFLNKPSTVGDHEMKSLPAVICLRQAAAIVKLDFNKVPFPRSLAAAP